MSAWADLAIQPTARGGAWRPAEERKKESLRRFLTDPRSSSPRRHPPTPPLPLIGVGAEENKSLALAARVFFPPIRFSLPSIRFATTASYPNAKP